MNIQKAKIEDHIRLTEITKKSKAYWGYSDEQMEKWSNNLTITIEYIETNSVFNLVDENQIIGYYSYLRLENNQVKLDNLFILPEYIGKGFGSFLMNDFVERMRNEKCQKIILDSEPNAEQFYQKIGFTKIGEFETSIKNRFMPIMEINL
ncbi:GNAT family N-acetyltransferase [Flavobacterium sp. SORGH_AS_0622]|jgi:ribosomal protein S18 acetylase RimI-like enzyme|uniref:GNAT family N-acetyltransferase n=1 Tax=Flavobacterium sp. SORGH_AS_0622 TaxID=3041772 RepID=UPI002789A889|nr:GNAT family N-acetyltransferase [Flavobacterium sp. SORGH_AS_0622]MDQ1164517.1 ribosomal protein S18 acetylase RimI-like enzyme [Flavobacterium sp. SORGH_AS_0622]